MQNFLQIFTAGGLSGDMFLAAFYDLGFPLNYLKENLQKIQGLPPLDFEIIKLNKSEIIASHIKIKVEDNMHHRSYKDIKKLLTASALSAIVKENSLAVFHLIAIAESKIHGKDIDTIHFHEVGSLDSIIDIVGFCLAIEFLQITNIYCEQLIFGNGNVPSAHGILPEPVPAVLEICKDLPFRTNPNNIGEMITPTGAALVAHFADFSHTPQNKKNSKIVYGAGSREYNFPNVLRLLMGEEYPENNLPKISSIHSSTNKNQPFLTSKNIICEKLYILECNIDDMNPQVFETIMEKSLSKVGVLDVWIEHILMKKNRPAFKISLLCEENKIEKAGNLLLEETTTLGFRLNPIHRYSLKRELLEVLLQDTKIKVKVATLENGETKFYPEYDDCKKFAEENNITLLKVIELVRELARENIYKYER